MRYPVTLTQAERGELGALLSGRRFPHRGLRYRECVGVHETLAVGDSPANIKAGRNREECFIISVMDRKPQTPPKKPLRMWRVTLLRPKGQYLGRVKAPDANAAIEAAVRQFGVDKAYRSRLIAEPVGQMRNVSNREIVQVAAIQLKLDRSQATAQEQTDFDAAVARMSHAELMALSLAAKLLEGRSQYMRVSGEWAERTRAVARLIGATEESRPDGGVVYHPPTRQ